MAARKSGSDAYNNGEGPFWKRSCINTLMFWVVRKVGSSFAGSCGSPVWSPVFTSVGHQGGLSTLDWKMMKNSLKNNLKIKYFSYVYYEMKRTIMSTYHNLICHAHLSNIIYHMNCPCWPGNCLCQPRSCSSPEFLAASLFGSSSYLSSATAEMYKNGHM